LVIDEERLSVAIGARLLYVVLSVIRNIEKAETGVKEELNASLAPVHA
jgi:hypothetical protein